MTSRVDPKPLYEHVTLLNATRPLFITQSYDILEDLAKRHKSHKKIQMDVYKTGDFLKHMQSASLFSDMIFSSIEEEILNGTDPAASASCTAAHMHKIFYNQRSQAYDTAICTAYEEVWKTRFNKINYFYAGSEAAMHLLNVTLQGGFVKFQNQSPNLLCAGQSLPHILALQAASCMGHPTAWGCIGVQHGKAITLPTQQMFTLYANAEKVLLRSSTKHLFQAHLHHSKKKAIGFVPRENIAKDFEVTDETRTVEHVGIFKLGATTHVVCGNNMYILSRDDIHSFLKMLRSLFNICLYFDLRTPDGSARSNIVLGICKSLVRHIALKIDMGVSFARTIRALHILNHELFNSIEETDNSTHHKERSTALLREAAELDKDAHIYFKQMANAASNTIDQLNTCYIYHFLVGDDAAASDLIQKLATAHKKIRTPDKAYFQEYLAFIKGYMLARFITVYRRIPSVDGEPINRHDTWVDACMSGNLMMPPKAKLGKTWIANEFTFVDYARFWALEVQDVTNIINDPDAYRPGKERLDANLANEILYTLAHGWVLDPLTSETAEQVIDSVLAGKKRTVTTFTAAAKNEASKPSYKKRATFAADASFRKVQSMIDKNISLFTEYIPGSVLALPYRSVEKKFKRIAEHTILEGHTLNTSHDVEAWSESQNREEFMAIMSLLLIAGKKPDFINIKQWWSVIKIIFNKVGTFHIENAGNGGFQGMPGRQDTVAHSLILLFWIYKLRQDGKIAQDAKTLHNACIDDCVASILTHEHHLDSGPIFEHLEAHYLKLGYVIDRIKSIISHLKAVFCARRFLRGIEVPCDLKTFLKHGTSFEAVIRSPHTILSEHMQSALGACAAGGSPMTIYSGAIITGLAFLTLYVPEVMKIPPSRIAVYCLTCADDNGWGVPDMVQWITQDVVDIRTRSNGIFISACECATTGFAPDAISVTQALDWLAIKDQPWETVSKQQIFRSPFRALKKGPFSPDLLIKHTMRSHILRMDIKDPWKSLLASENSTEMETFYDALYGTCTVDALVTNALSDCMPQAFLASMEAKCSKSATTIETLSQSERFRLQRRVADAGRSHVLYLFESVGSLSAPDPRMLIAELNTHDFTSNEKDAFMSINGCTVINHTFPDPILTYSRASVDSPAYISFKHTDTYPLARNASGTLDPRILRTKEGLYVPPKALNVLDYSNKKLLAWDPITRMITTGLTVLAAAQDMGHEVSGLTAFFLTLWNKHASITLENPMIPSIKGSIKRLTLNPGSASHPIFALRNLSQHVIVNMMGAYNCLPAEGHMHDVLASTVALRAAALITASECVSFGIDGFEWMMVLRADHVMRLNTSLMNTAHLISTVTICIDDSKSPWDFRTICPQFSALIDVVTLQSSSARFMDALLTEDKTSYYAALDAAAAHVAAVGLEAAAAEQGLFPHIAKFRTPFVFTSHDVQRTTQALMLSGPRIHSGEVRDQFYAGLSRPKLEMYTSGIQASEDSKVCASIIRSTLVQALVPVDEDSVLALAFDVPEGQAAALAAITADRVWERALAGFALALGSSYKHNIISAGFSRLGCPGFRADNKVSLQMLKSFAGMNAHKLCRAVVSEFQRSAGVSKMNFHAVPRMIVVTSDYEKFNYKKRAETLKSMIHRNIVSLKDRIRAITRKEMVHHGDIYAINTYCTAAERKARLRVRVNTMACIHIDDRASYSEFDVREKFATKIATSIKRILNRNRRSAELEHHIPELPTNYANNRSIYLYMQQVEQFLNANKVTHKFSLHWGFVGFEEAMAWVSIDVEAESKIVYAYGPSHINTPGQKAVGRGKKSHESLADVLRSIPPDVHIGNTAEEAIAYVVELYTARVNDPTIKQLPAPEVKDAHEEPAVYVSAADTYSSSVPDVDPEVITIHSPAPPPNVEVDRSWDVPALHIPDPGRKPVSSMFLDERSFERALQDWETKNAQRTLARTAAGFSDAIALGATIQQRLLCCYINDIIVAENVRAKVPDLVVSDWSQPILVGIALDPMNRPDAWIVERFGDLIDLYEGCEMKYVPGTEAILSIQEDSDLAAD